MRKIIQPKKFISGVINLPGDKSIAHRALILGAISNGLTKIKNFPANNSCMTMLNCLRELGTDIKIISDTVIINSHGLNNFVQPKKILDAKSSATTLRLLLGILAAQKFPSKIKCSGSLKNRPMSKTIEPLLKMGADILYDNSIFYLRPANLSSINYKLPIPSAQIKSSIIFAGLYCNGMTKITESISSRDHTENMLNYFGARIIKNENQILFEPPFNLSAKEFVLPADISSAAFFIVLALVSPGAHIILNNVLINPRRMGLVKILKQMGARIIINSCREIYPGENIADLEVFYSHLKAVKVFGDIIVDMIDEIPVFIIAALFANGTTIIKNAEQLKFKESNRIMCVAEEFNKLGAKIKPTDDGMIIESGINFNDAELFSHFDHRIAMSLAIFSSAINKKLVVNNIECIADSFSEFFEYMNVFF